MSALTFDKSELGNLEYSLQREMLATDRRGGYMSTTIVGCNTRRYHGLIVAPIDASDRTYVLLSSLDETVVEDGQAFNLALHRFPGSYEPRGHKYITDFEYTPTPTLTYRVGNIILRKELLWVHHRTQLMIRYTLVEAPSSATLRLRPFFAYRDKHALTCANLQADGRSYPIPGGVKSRLYPDFPWLHLQTDHAAEFVPAPDWYHNFEYRCEIERGYEGHEDLLTSGYFELELKPGESVIFSASTEEMRSEEELRTAFAEALAARSNKIDLRSCLEHSARQFIIRRPGRGPEVLSGYPWYGVDGRQTLLALPGITLEQGHVESCLEVLDAIVADRFAGSYSVHEAVDAPLWFFWTLQQVARNVGAEAVWNRYGGVMKELLESYRCGAEGCVTMGDDGLLRTVGKAGETTWMNPRVNGELVIPRGNCQVEVNALWYNAICYALDLARRFGDSDFVARWEALPERLRESFTAAFWNEMDDCLYDYLGEEGPNPFIRPNQIVACGLDYKMLDEVQQIAVIRTVRRHLLTPRGLRSLSPRNPLYKGHCQGDADARSRSAMNGGVWVWPLWFYVKGCFDIMGADFLPQAEEILAQFGDEIQSYGIGSINEYFDGDPPYVPRGAISQAWSVGAVLMIFRLTDEYRPTKAAKQTKTKERRAK